MFSRTLRSLRHTLALRLTLWYAGIFVGSSILAFSVVYLVLVSTVQERTDDDLEEDLEEFTALMQSGGLDRVRAEVDLEVQGGASDSFFGLWTADGRQLLARGFGASSVGVPGEDALRLGEADEPILKTLLLPEEELRMRVIQGAIGPGVVLQVGQSLEEDEEFLHAALHGFLLALAAVLLLGGPIGWFMARRALRGVNEVTRTATRIAEGALDQRVAAGTGGDEIALLARAFNLMLDRIQALIHGMREMTDNLAHDFRSPLARIRAGADMSLAADRSKEEWASLAGSTTEECDRLMEMIDATLDIAEAESGAAKLKITDVDLVDLVLGACDVFKTVAEDKEVAITSELPDRCHIQGDLHRLQRVVANLVDNALKYTSPGGEISIRLVDEGEAVRLSVADTGPGLPADQLPRIFERFYRADRSRSSRGNGLGLSLALAFVRAHGGDITVSSDPEQGSTFTVVLTRSRSSR
jgi:heavy metal sensor kinase